VVAIVAEVDIDRHAHSRHAKSEEDEVDDSKSKFTRVATMISMRPASSSTTNSNESEYPISLCNEQATDTLIAREYSSTTELTSVGICFRSTDYHSDRCARLCKCWNASFSKRDYG
jgi:hypothetical protein